jgi:signal transduction histidine kinase
VSYAPAVGNRSVPSGSKSFVARRGGERSLATLGIAGLLVVFIAGVVTLPSRSHAIHVWTDLGWTVFSVMATVVGVRVARRMALPGRRRAWWAFALGCATWSLGIFEWSYLELAVGIVTPFPAYGDIGYLATPVCFALGLFYYGSDAPGVKATTKQIGELGIVLATMGLTFGFIFGDAIEHGGTSLAYRCAALAYPVLHSTAVTFAMTTLWSRTWQRRSLRVVAFVFSALLALTIVNTYYAQTLLLGTYEVGHFMDPGWCIAFAFVALAGVEELEGVGSRGEDERIRATMGDIIIPSVCLAVVSISGYFQGFHAESSAGYLAVMGVLLAVALGVRNHAQREIEIALRDEVRDRERQFVEAQKLEAVATLAGGLAHDFNNLLTGVLGGVSMLRLGQKRGTSDPSHLDLIEQSAERAAELTKRLLVFARRREPQIAPTRPFEILGRAAMLVRSASPENVVVRESGEPRDLVVDADASQLEHALVNLGLNAVHAMPNGGQLEFVLSVTRRGENSGPDGAWVVFEVRDTGVGIADEAQARIFEPFYSTRGPGEGTGLGLAMVKSTAAAHGGFVELDSDIGRGSTFRLGIPLVPSSSLALPDVEASSMATGHETILVIDDRAAALLATQSILESLGYRVRACSREAEAYRAVEEEREIDLLLIDLVLPETDGIAVAAAIRKSRPLLPVLLMTGHLRPTELPAFVFDVVEKPYRSRDLAASVRAAIDASRRVVRDVG